MLCENCADGTDNDCDSFGDASDPDCRLFPDCIVLAAGTDPRVEVGKGECDAQPLRIYLARNVGDFDLGAAAYGEPRDSMTPDAPCP